MQEHRHSRRSRSTSSRFVTTVQKTAPELFYRLNEKAGTQAVDLSGHMRHGTYTSLYTLGGPPPVASRDINSGSVYFSSSGSATTTTLAVPTSFTYPAGSAISVMFWIYRNTNDANYAFFFGSDRTSSHCPWTDGTVYWDCGGCCSGNQRLTASASLMNGSGFGAWNHVTYVSTGAANTFQAIYFNGVMVASKGSSQGESTTTTGGTIGGHASDIGINGSMAEFALWLRVLTTVEIQMIYQASTMSQLLKN